MKQRWANQLRRSRELLTISALAVLRVGVGVVMTAHGTQKLSNPGEWIDQVRSLGVWAPDVFGWLAIAGEFLGGIGLIVGLLTPVAAFGIASVMVGAILTVHWGNGLFAANGGWEHPLVILLVALAFIAKEGGPLSIDGLIRRRSETSLSGHEQVPGATRRAA